MKPNLRTSKAIQDAATREQFDKILRFLPPFLGLLSSDPVDADFSDADEGVFWYSLTSHVFKYWNGTTIKTVATA